MHELKRFLNVVFGFAFHSASAEHQVCTSWCYRAAAHLVDGTVLAGCTVDQVDR